MGMFREEAERSGRNGYGMHEGRNGYGMYDRGREFESERGGRRDEMSFGPMRRGRGMDTVRHANIVKVIEVLAESEHSWEDAAQNALMEAQRSIRNIKSIWVKDMQCVVRDGRIRLWRLNAKISFGIESDQHDSDYREA